MKYLKKYKLFTEEVDFETNITDEPDLKMSKEKLETLKKNLTDYKTKKPLLDKAYLTALTDIDLKSAVDGIVGKTDALPEKDRNLGPELFMDVSSSEENNKRLLFADAAERRRDEPSIVIDDSAMPIADLNLDPDPDPDIVKSLIDVDVDIVETTIGFIKEIKTKHNNINKGSSVDAFTYLFSSVDAPAAAAAAAASAGEERSFIRLV